MVFLGLQSLSQLGARGEPTTAIKTNPRLGRMSLFFTPYFENKVLAKLPYITRGMCIRVVQSPLRTQMQTDGERVTFWARVPELNGRVLSVMTLPEKDSLYIDQASKHLDLKTLDLRRIPFGAETVAG